MVYAAAGQPREDLWQLRLFRAVIPAAFCGELHSPVLVLSTLPA